MQIKTTLKFYLAMIKKKIKNTDDNNCSYVYGEIKMLIYWQEQHTVVQLPWKTIWTFFKSLNIFTV